MNGQTEAVSTWSKLVHNKNITMDEVKEAYKDWAGSYDAHFDLLHENSKFLSNGSVTIY